MSFYLNIRSTDSLDIFPNNYGGDFQVELSTPLHFDENDPWEVALVEMMYEAQPFPNIPAEYSHFTIEHLNKDKFFNTKDLDFSISAIIRVTTYGIWRDSNSELLPEYRRFPKYVLPRKNYTWEGFKAEINKLNYKKVILFLYRLMEYYYVNNNNNADSILTVSLFNKQHH